MTELLQSTGNLLSGDHARAIYWAFAIAGTAVFAVTGVMHAFGAGSVEGMPDDVDTDLDGDVDLSHADTGFADFKFLSLRTVLAFVTMFGWGGVVWGRSGWSGFASAFACGLVMMVLTALTIWLILKMQQSGNVGNAELTGKQGIVYMAIAANRKHTGKVTVNAGHSTREIRALADEALPQGTPVVVEKYLGGRVFFVKKN